MIRLFASILLVLGLLLMPFAMAGHAASAMEPATVSTSACPDHHEPTTPDAPAPKGMVHCAMCVALPQPDLAMAPQVTALTGVGNATAPPRLQGVTPAVSDPPPKVA